MIICHQIYNFVQICTDEPGTASYYVVYNR